MTVEPKSDIGRERLERIRRIAIDCGLSDFVDRIPGEYLDDGRLPLAMDVIGAKLGTCRAQGCGRRLYFFRRTDPSRWLVVDEELTAHWPRCPGKDARGVRKAPKRRAT